MSCFEVVRIFIEPSECLSHSLCENEVPNKAITMTALTPSGYEVSEIHHDRISRTKNDLLIMLAAADMCPVDAFYIELKDGTVMNVWDDRVQKKIKSGEIEWA